MPVAQLFHETGPARTVTVVLTGGVRTPSDALVGPVSDWPRCTTLHTDQLFLGVHGLDVRAGLTTPNLVPRPRPTAP